jgi:hypothetical protein
VSAPTTGLALRFLGLRQFGLDGKPRVAGAPSVLVGHGVVVPGQGPLVSLGPVQVDPVSMVVWRLLDTGVPLVRSLAEAHVAKGLVI